MNKKLDEISDKLDDIKQLIKALPFETQRASYLSAESDVNYGYNKLKDFYVDFDKVSCTNEQSCKRKRIDLAHRYLPYFQKVEQSMYQILRGSVETSPFKEPLLDLVLRRYECNVEKLTTFTEYVITLAQKGQQTVLTYQKLTMSSTDGKESMDKWFDAVFKVKEYYYTKKAYCYSTFYEDVKKEVQDLKYQRMGGSNTDANNAIVSTLEAKYHWIKFVSGFYSFFFGGGYFLLLILVYALFL